MSTQSFKAMPWFRLYHEFATDHKIQMLSEADQRRYIMLLCLRCSNGNVTFHDAQIAFSLRISLEEWETTKNRFIEQKFIDKHNRILNWEKRQHLSDSSTARVRKHRERMKQACNVSVTEGNDCETVTVTPPDTDTDTEYVVPTVLVDLPSTPKAPSIPYQKIIETYNEICVPKGRPAARRNNTKRQARIRSLWNESDKVRSLDWWRSYFAKAMTIDYIVNGFTSRDGRHWNGADLDYLLQDKTITRIVEGSYDHAQR